MQLHEVTSSKLMRVGYDEAKEILVCQFPEGKQSVYAYLGVDPLLYDGMMEADSKGSYFLKNIRGKNGQPIHEFKKLGEGTMVSEAGTISDDAVAGLTAKKPDAPLFAEQPKGMPLPPAPDIHKPKPQAQGEVLPPLAVDTIPELPAKDEELKTRALTVQEQARAMKITSGVDFARVEAWLITIKREAKLVYERLDRVVAPALLAYREAQKLRDESVSPYGEAERILKDSMKLYIREEEAMRRRAEQEETAKRQEQARLDAEVVARQQAEDDARTFEAQGEPEMAASVRANPLPIAPVRVAPVVLERDVPKGASSIREKYTYRVLDESRIPLTHQFYSLDPKKLKAYAETMKMHGTIPGILEIYDEGVVSVRTKAS